MAQVVMRAPLRLLLPLLLPFTAALQRSPSLARRLDASLPHRFDAALPHRLDASLPQRTALGAVAGGLGDAGPADDAAVRAWASQLRAVVAKRSPPAAAGVAVGLAGRVAATGRVSPKLAARLVFGSFVLLSTALVAPERAAVAKRQKRVPAVVIARQLAIAAGAAVVASIAPTRRSAVALAVLAAVARWARGGEDGFAARVATKAAELRAVAELRCRGISTPMAEFCARSPRSGQAEGPGAACAASSKLCEARIGLAPALAARMRSARPLCGQLGG